MSETQFAKIKMKLDHPDIAINQKFNVLPEIFHQIFPICNLPSAGSPFVKLSEDPQKQIDPQHLIPLDYEKGIFNLDSACKIRIRLLTNYNFDIKEFITEYQEQNGLFKKAKNNFNPLNVIFIRFSIRKITLTNKKIIKKKMNLKI